MRSPIIVAAFFVTGMLAASPAAADPGDTWIRHAGPAVRSEVSHAQPMVGQFSARCRLRPARCDCRIAAERRPGRAARRPVPVEYSEGYKTRAKIHKIASFATLPLFVANYFVGQDLYNNPGDESKKGAARRAWSPRTGVLFGVNTFTGAWNLWEGRKDPNHRTQAHDPRHPDDGRRRRVPGHGHARARVGRGRALRRRRAPPTSGARTGPWR